MNASALITRPTRASSNLLGRIAWPWQPVHTLHLDPDGSLRDGQVPSGAGSRDRAPDRVPEPGVRDADPAAWRNLLTLWRQRNPQVATGSRVRLVLPDAWTRCFTVQTPRGVQGRGDIDAAIHLRFEQLYGDDPQTWWFDAQPDPTLRFLVMAMPAALGLEVLDAAIELDLRLESIAPATLHAWQQLSPAVRQGPGWWVRREPEVNGEDTIVRVIARSRAGWHTVDQSAGSRPAWDTPVNAQAWLSRTALTLGEPMPSRVHVLAGADRPVRPNGSAVLYTMEIDGQHVTWVTDGVVNQPTPESALEVTSRSSQLTESILE